MSFRPVTKSGVRKTPLLEENQVRELLKELDIPKTMKPDRKHPQVLRPRED